MTVPYFYVDNVWDYVAEKRKTLEKQQTTITLVFNSSAEWSIKVLIVRVIMYFLFYFNFVEMTQNNIGI